MLKRVFSQQRIRLSLAARLLCVLAGSALPNMGNAAEANQQYLFIREIRVQGATVLPTSEIQRIIYPFVGPGRTLADIESARAALEKLYHDSGYQVARVEIPAQQARHGIIFLKVTEGSIGRLRVTGSKYNDIDQIRQEAPSLAEGKVPYFKAISQDIIALNQRADRRVIPDIKPGSEPGVLDVNLKVEDRLPATASVELNNRYSADTTKLRLNLAFSYDNLWQKGHSIGGSLQTTPLDWFDEVMVYSGYYTARFEGLPEWTFQASATKQDSNISTLGGATVAGRGDIFSFRATRVLPSPFAGMYHSLSIGLERKHFTQLLNTAGTTTNTPVTYYPIGLLYSGVVQREHSETDFFLDATFNPRGFGSDSAEFELNRSSSDPGFFTLRGDVSEKWNLPGDFTAMVRGQGQVSSGPLLSNEQFSAGGRDTVRGYLEGESLGDYGFAGTLELGSPTLISAGRFNNRLTLHAFVDGAMLFLSDPLPSQDDQFNLASYGAGMRLRLFDHFEGSLELAVPLFDEGQTKAGDPHLIFILRGNL